MNKILFFTILLFTLLSCEKALFKKDTIPDTFISEILNFITLLINYNIKGYEKQNYLLECYKNNKLLKKSKISKESKTSKESCISKKTQLCKPNTNCNHFLNEKEIENILIPRYNYWVKLFEFE